MPSFSNLGLSLTFNEHLTSIGFNTPTPIQMETIPYILNNATDIIAQAQTGTGKTAAFGIPIIEQLPLDNTSVNTLILTPTRELAIQISSALSIMATPFKTKMTAIYGGQSFDPQIKSLKKGADIVIGTPGRVLDMLKKRHLNISQIRYLVIDEADEMLRFGFLEDLETIFTFTNTTKQTLLFSATMPSAIVKLSKRYMTDPHRITVKPTHQKTDAITQHYMTVSGKSKSDALLRLIDSEDSFYGLIFCNTKRQVDDIALFLINKGYNADALHGDLTQSAREKVLAKFRKKHCTILVVTDVVSRGIDIEKLTHVVNYSPPQDLDAYIHRIGRTGRGGETGTAYTLVSKSESRLFRPILRHFESALTLLSPPSIDDILAAKRRRLIQAITHQLDIGVSDEYQQLATDIVTACTDQHTLAATLAHLLKSAFSKSQYRPIKTESLDHQSGPPPSKRRRFSPHTPKKGSHSFRRKRR